MLAGTARILRSEGPFSPESEGIPWKTLLTAVGVCGFGYGAIMGGYGLRLPQALFAGLKVPLLLLASCVVCLPSLYVLHAVLGLADDFARGLRSILASQAAMAVTLLSLGPLTMVFYVSNDDYLAALMINGAMFALATFAGQLVLVRQYRGLVRRNPRHRIVRQAWLVLYVFVSIQAAWVLRPYIGAPSLPTTFFREDAWSNAYVVVADRVYEFFLGR
jgi:hypothetical protein